ncbi:MAG: flagellin, partial [Halobacteriaceae archaeon]
VLINTAGFLQSQSEQTGEQSSQQVTNRLDAVAVTGTVKDTAATSSGKSIEEINLTVKKAPGAEDIDLQNVTIQWIGPEGAETLTIDTVNDGNADFNTSVIKDADGSSPVLNDPDDRIDVGINTTQAGLSPLEAGETATLTITTAAGGTTEVRIQVPQSLSGEQAVEL